MRCKKPLSFIGLLGLHFSLMSNSNFPAVWWRGLTGVEGENAPLRIRQWQTSQPVGLAMLLVGIEEGSRQQTLSKHAIQSPDFVANRIDWNLDCSLWIILFLSPFKTKSHLSGRVFDAPVSGHKPGEGELETVNWVIPNLDSNYIVILYRVRD